MLDFVSFLLRRSSKDRNSSSELPESSRVDGTESVLLGGASDDRPAGVRVERALLG